MNRRNLSVHDPLPSPPRGEDVGRCICAGSRESQGHTLPLAGGLGGGGAADEMPLLHHASRSPLPRQAGRIGRDCARTEIEEERSVNWGPRWKTWGFRDARRIGRRIMICGPSNSGKSTLARAIGWKLDLPAIHTGPALPPAPHQLGASAQGGVRGAARCGDRGRQLGDRRQLLRRPCRSGWRGRPGSSCSAANRGGGVREMSAGRCLRRGAARASSRAISTS